MRVTGETGYAPPVSATDDARRAQHELEQLDKRATEVRACRDELIWQAHINGEGSAAEIAGALGLSKSAVIVILRIQRSRSRP